MRVLSDEDVLAIRDAVVGALNINGSDEIDAEDACRILGVKRRTLREISRKYPEIQNGKGSHIFKRSAVRRVANLRGAR